MVDKHTLAKQYKNYLLERKRLEEETGEKQPLILPIQPGNEIYIETQNPDGTISVRPRFPAELNYYFRLLSDYKKYELLIRPEADQLRILTALAERERAKQPQQQQQQELEPQYAPGSPGYAGFGSEETISNNESPGYIPEPSASSVTIVKEPETKSSILTVEKEEEKGESEGQSEGEEGEKEESNNETKKIIKL
jgi:hypothetical protein